MTRVFLLLFAALAVAFLPEPSAAGAASGPAAATAPDSTTSAGPSAGQAEVRTPPSGTPSARTRPTSPAGRGRRQPQQQQLGRVGGPVRLAERPGTDLDRAARQLAAPDITAVQRAGEVPLVLAGSAKLSGSRDAAAAVFVQLQSPRECGSAGCSTSAYFRGRKVLDAVSGQIVVDGQRHRGMHDLIVGEGTRYVWNGAAYADARPAPNVNLRPRRPAG